MESYIIVEFYNKDQKLPSWALILCETSVPVKETIIFLMLC
jgi:hypothetical protein